MIEIISFGYLHGLEPEATFTYDLRVHFRDPHVRPEFRDLTAEHLAVWDAVMSARAFRA